MRRLRPFMARLLRAPIERPVYDEREASLRIYPLPRSIRAEPKVVSFEERRVAP